MAPERRAVVRGIAQPELLLNGGRKLPVGQIAPGAGTARSLQFGLEELGRQFHDVIKARPLHLALAVSLGNHRHGQPGFLRQPFHRLGEAQPLLFHKKCENVA